MTLDSGCAIRPADAADVPALCAFIFEHGPNPWNFLPPAAVREHLQGIAEGVVQALLVEQGDRLAGFVTFLPSRQFNAYQPEARRDLPQAYIGEAVVDRALAGQGLGSALLQAAVAALASQGIRDIYIERHEQNPGSAGMMRKAGFVERSTFDDPQRRAGGSRRTTLCYLWVPH